MGTSIFAGFRDRGVGARGLERADERRLAV